MFFRSVKREFSIENDRKTLAGNVRIIESRVNLCVCVMCVCMMTYA